MGNQKHFLDSKELAKTAKRAKHWAVCLHVKLSLLVLAGGLCRA